MKLFVPLIFYRENGKRKKLNFFGNFHRNKINLKIALLSVFILTVWEM